MIVMSQNLTNYDIPMPENVVLRINLAWIDSIQELNKILEKHKQHKIFLDLPIKRVKPPNNQYTINELVPIIKSNKQISYLAISNVKSSSDITPYMKLLPSNVILVPKIETVEAILNIDEIVGVLRDSERILMLDHDDLFTSITNSDEPISNFRKHVNELVTFCDKQNITLLRVQGVIFSDSM